MKIVRRRDTANEDRDDGRTITRLLSDYEVSCPDSLSMIVSDIPAGCVEDKHYHSESLEMFYYLTPGSVEIDGEIYSLDIGDLVVLEKEDVHQIRAQENMQILVIRVPDADDKVVVPEG